MQFPAKIKAHIVFLCVIVWVHARGGEGLQRHAMGSMHFVRSNALDSIYSLWNNLPVTVICVYVHATGING